MEPDVLALGGEGENADERCRGLLLGSLRKSVIMLRESNGPVSRMEDGRWDAVCGLGHDEARPSTE